MRKVVFVVPVAMEATLRFVRAAADLPELSLGVVSQQPASAFPEELRSRFTGFAQTGNALDGTTLADAVRACAREMGGEVDRLIGILEPLQVALAEVREQFDIPGMDVETACNFRDKARMKDVLRKNDVPCARHALAENADQAHAFAERCGFPLVVKPPAGAGAKNTYRLDGPADLDGYLKTVPFQPGEPVLFEEFITGREYSFDTVTIDGQHVFHSISHYLPPPLEVMETPWIQWSVLLPRDVSGPEYDDIRAAGRKSLDCLGLVTGLTHMEWFRRDDGGIAISEVAARPPGAQFTSLLSYAHDIDFYRAWSHLVSFEEFEVPERKYATGAVYLRGQGEGRVVNVRGLEKAQEELGELVVEAKLPSVGQAPTGSYEGEGCVILRHPDTEVVDKGLRRLLDLISVELG
ncbi:MAG: ATP-grasp domain-containing protein [Planctomycetota bacterium]|nr:ATP-grasp domain-containing protein [Planctomycetota bacterium]